MMKPVSKLQLPPSPLSGCVFAAICRDTRGAALSDEDRVSYFPASPLVTLTLVRTGKLYMLPTGRDWHDVSDLTPLPRLSATPPTDVPISSWAPDDIEAISFGIYPDAWVQLGGDTGFSHIPPGLKAAVDAFDAHDDVDAGWSAFSTCLEKVWAAERRSWPAVTSISDWVRGLMVRTLTTGRGKSLRSLERRLKRFSGQSKRALDFHASFDNLHRVFYQHPKSPLAEIAVEAGYSDQSHMGRAVRRATGFSPAHLNRRIDTDEAFWCYRVLGERF